MLFLIQTVSRQFTEQREYSPKGVEPCPSKRRAQAATAKGDPHFPDHDLEPPKFARKALELIIQEWSAVKNMVMSGSKDTAGARYGQRYLDHGQICWHANFCLLLKLFMQT